MRFILARSVLVYLTAALFFTASGQTPPKDEICSSCHIGKYSTTVYPLRSEYKDSHKVGEAPPAEMIPNNLPLINSEIVCSTCHVADWEKTHAKANVGKPFLRVDASDSKLCLSCHKDTLGERSHPLHIISTAKDKVECISCHAPHGASGGHLLRASGEGVDLCRKCHIDKFPRAD
ncbi:MAG: cytochrome c3 family protein, partial [Deferribacteraceae bacterium]|nr:cytochrome c3 family protein [Deferribacteraceae bacterium]